MIVNELNVTIFDDSLPSVVSFKIQAIVGFYESRLSIVTTIFDLPLLLVPTLSVPVQVGPKIVNILNF